VNPEQELIEHDISHEMWREYEWIDPDTGNVRVYRIENPVALYLRPGGSTHRVVDVHGVAHCAPNVGRFGCVLRWQNPPGTPPVNF